MSKATLSFASQRWLWKQCSSQSTTESSILDEVNLPEDDNYKTGWTKAAHFPSEIHVELLNSKAIPDPYVGFNEHKVQWIGEVEWLYKCHFPFDTTLNHGHALLQFEGLDTICDVYLNGEKILATNNMFRTYDHAFSLTGGESLLKADNTLLLHFKSAKRLAKAEEEKYGKVRAGSTNLGDPSRVYVRKAQYDWRWDWGPELMTCGPYRPITLTTYDVLIKDVHARAFADIQPDGSFAASLKVNVTLSGTSAPSNHVLVVSLSNQGQDLVSHRILPEKMSLGKSSGDEVIYEDAVSFNDLEGLGVQLWWPVGYGDQPTYTVSVALLTQSDVEIDLKTKRVGFRTVQLIQEAITEPDQYGTGTSFLFEINGVRMFMGGSNWIPADNFLTTISDERYRAWLTLLRDGNQNMVRLWGGGIYEPDIFYDICDELGILVWQDFQFACGVYPAHDEFVASVKQEAEDNVKRLRHHPSIACFCGNNEDYQQVLQWGGIGGLPARLIYEHVLPDVVSRLTDPPIPYHRGSPYGGKDWDTSDPTVGDVHQWNVWGGKELPYQEYDKLGGRFVSEFGIPSMPSMSTIDYFMDGSDKSQYYAQSQLMAQHTKAGSFERRFAIVMNENFKLTSDFETHAFNTQLMQSEAVSYAYRVWRREWRGKGKEYTAGVLVWQMNDCWPVLRPKAVFYTIARQLAPITVGIFRTVLKNRDNDRPRQFYEFGAIQSTHASLDIWATNGTLQTRAAKLELKFFDLHSSDWSHSETREVSLLPNQTTELTTLLCPGPGREGVTEGDPLFVSSATVVASARLLDVETGIVLARYSDWPEPYRFLEAPDAGLKVTLEEGDEARLTVTVERPAKCVFFSVGDSGAEPKWSDNALDVVPGDTQVVVVKGLNGRQVKVAYFGQENAQNVKL
ncbi:glycoside hydrolase superfamily [Crassisporium funariophilum]|nr:glycoside hydrolase superfamily [Crassisporium funariophilum]